MAFESVRAYFQLASGLGDLSRARAVEAAQGLLSMSGVGNATGKVAVQVGTLAEELLAAAVTNREHLTTLVRSEVDVAVSRLGLVSAEKLDESRAEVARLRAEVAQLRSAAFAERTPAERTPAKRTAAKTAPRKTSAAKATARKAPSTDAEGKTAPASKVTTAAKTAAKPATARRSAVTTRRTPGAT